MHTRSRQHFIRAAATYLWDPEYRELFLSSSRLAMGEAMSQIRLSVAILGTCVTVILRVRPIATWMTAYYQRLSAN
jgi:hypothetical protein